MTENNKNSHIVARLIQEIDKFIARYDGLDDASFGYYCIGDVSLVSRLKNGGDVTTRTAERIVDFITKPDQRFKKRWKTKGAKK